MNKTVIGVISRAEYLNKAIMYIEENIRRIIYNNNCIPLLILPNQDIEYKMTVSKDMKPLTSQEKKQLMSLVDEIDGLIMPGGSRQYEYDKFIYKYAYSKNIPVLGICMGMQLMCNVDNELKVEHDVPIKNDSTINHCIEGGEYAHEVDINPSTKLYEIVNKKTIMVNSLHNYHIDKVNNLKVSARSNDGYIEAVEDSNRDFVIGVQWHPEKISLNDIYNERIINEFLKKAKEVSSARNIKENI